jgi:hypothetical protein
MSTRAPKWSRNDLERRLCHALDIAWRAVDRLAAEGYKDGAQPDNNVRAEKVISETAVLLLAASNTKADEVQQRIHRVANKLAPYARNESMRLALCLEPSLALDFATAHLCLKRLGYADADFDRLLEQALQSQTAGGRERVPHRMLEQEWLRQLGPGVMDNGRRLARTARASVLGMPMDLLSGSRDDVYAFTHALMYVTGCWLPRPRTTILAEAEGALARCLDEEDYDLGGEVLLAWPLTGKTWSAAATFGLQVLTRVEDRAGFLPAPITRLQRLKELEGDDRAGYLLATGYHTVYVMGLLCAAALQPGRIPPAMVPTGTSVRGGVHRLLEIIDDGRHRAHWRDEFDGLSRAHQDSLAGLLLGIGLRRKTKQRDYAGVACLLREGHALGLTNRPAASQAAEMLERLALYGRTTGLRLTA